MMLASLAHRNATFVALILIIVIYGIPIWALISVFRNLRGGFRIFWILLIIAGFFIVPLIGIILSVMFLVFKRRFVAAQSSMRRR